MLSTQHSLVVLVGPTAVGKTALSLRLAREFGGEVINADSRQIYRTMDIGTAKPSPAERAAVPHHLFDVVDPDQVFSVAQFQDAAYAVIDAIFARSRLPLLVGGSGLWVWAVVEGHRIPRVPPNPVLRAELEQQGAMPEGRTALYEELMTADPEAARKIDPRNLRRLVRALEVIRETGRPFSALKQKQPPPYDILIVGLTVDRAELYRRIDDRVEDQIRQGLVDEVRGLLARGYSWDLPSMSGLGYREIGLCLRGEVDLPGAKQLIKHHTHRFARQQHAWFRLDDPRIHWFRAEPGYEPSVERLVSRFVSGETV